MYFDFIYEKYRFGQQLQKEFVYRILVTAVSNSAFAIFDIWDWEFVTSADAILMQVKD
jgi:hypothetical protein